MYTREQLLKREVSCIVYTRQFVTKGLIDYVCSAIGKDKILQSVDPYFNDIPLKLWTDLRVFKYVSSKLWEELNGPGHSVSDSVSIAKTAAGVVREKEGPELTYDVCIWFDDESPRDTAIIKTLTGTAEAIRLQYSPPNIMDGKKFFHMSFVRNVEIEND